MFRLLTSFRPLSLLSRSYQAWFTFDQSPSIQWVGVLVAIGQSTGTIRCAVLHRDSDKAHYADSARSLPGTLYGNKAGWSIGAPQTGDIQMIGLEG